MQNNAAILSTSSSAGTPSVGTLPLALATMATPVTVTLIRGKDETRRFLTQMGFVEGAVVSVINENGGNIIVDVKGARLAISRSMAMRIMVA